MPKQTRRNHSAAFKAKAAETGAVLTEAQVVALEKAKTDKEVHSEFESECPGRLVPLSPVPHDVVIGGPEWRRT